MSKFKSVTIHRPKSQRLTLEQFCFFLAGLIDADGHINKVGNIIIAFHSRDINTAYYIKTRIGYGRVSSSKKKNAVTYVCSHPIGKNSISQYIRNRLINPDRIKQFNARLVPKRLLSIITEPGVLSFQNHWLAGFIQGDGSFQIKLVSKKNRPKKEVRLVLQIDLKQLSILEKLKASIGGYIGYRPSQNTYYYSSVSFERAARLIKYLDRFQVMGSCLTLYWMWRKCYIIVQNKDHLSQKGIERIAKIKTQMSKLRLN
jgi:hypothetical protein